MSSIAQIKRFSINSLKHAAPYMYTGVHMGRRPYSGLKHLCFDTNLTKKKISEHK